MFPRWIRLSSRFCHRRILPPTITVSITGIALLTTPGAMLGQRTGHNSRPLICVHDCRDPTDTTPDDDLKDFNRTMAVQATPEQSKAFTVLVQDVQAASARLQAFRGLLQKGTASPALSDPEAILAQAIAKVRTGTQTFVASFSAAQKSGLKDLTKKVEEADSGVAMQIGMLDEIVQPKKAVSENIADSAAILDKALASYQKEQLTLGREMGIILPSTDLSFNLPPATSSVEIGGGVISIPASGTVSRISAVDGHNLFSLNIAIDLSDLQQNITGILRAQLTRSPPCGERIEIREATLTDEAPATDVVTRLHLERWICPPGQGWAGPTELATGDGTIDVKLTPAIEKDGSLGLVSEIGRIDADGFLRESLRGSLGSTLRNEITASILSVMRKATDLKAILPPSAQGVATVQKAHFQETAARLSLALDGQMEFSDDQTKQFVSQLNQRLSTQQTSAR